MKMWTLLFINHGVAKDNVSFSNNRPILFAKFMIQVKVHVINMSRSITIWWGLKYDLHKSLEFRFCLLKFTPKSWKLFARHTAPAPPNNLLLDALSISAGCKQPIKSEMFLERYWFCTESSGSARLCCFSKAVHLGKEIKYDYAVERNRLSAVFKLRTGVSSVNTFQRDGGKFCHEYS